jgi:beta-barrel assembly-enhancing protease
MKKIKHILLLFFLLQSGTLLFSQRKKVYTAEGTVIQNSVNTERIVLMVDDEEMEFLFNASVKYGKKTKPDDLRYGLKVKVDYILLNQDYIIKEVRILNNKVDEKIEFKGVFEYYEDGIALIDGRKVRLSADGLLECTGKSLFGKHCGCDKAKPYKGFSDPSLQKGAFLSVHGKLDSSGVIVASRINVCKNAVSKDEVELRSLVESSYNTKGLVKVKAPKNFNVANGLYKGTIVIGDLEYKLSSNVNVQGYINMVGNKILPKYAQDTSFLNANDIRFRFHVIENNIPNAFAYPNGMIFIHTGLLSIMTNEAQLALVLGHEIAHVLYEHSVDRYKKSKLLDNTVTKGLFSFLKAKVGLTKKKDKEEDEIEEDDNDSFDASLNNLVNRFSPQNLSGLFEKRKETQADRIGLMYMHTTGYDLREAPKFWLKMKELTGEMSFQQKLTSNATGLIKKSNLSTNKDIIAQLGGKALEVAGVTLLENIYASHPLAKKRYDDINELIATYYRDVDFSKAFIGAREFYKFVGHIK